MTLGTQYHETHSFIFGSWVSTWSTKLHWKDGDFQVDWITIRLKSFHFTNVHGTIFMLIKTDQGP